MTTTAAGTLLLNIARDAGFKPYDMHAGCDITSKLTRFRTPSGRPIAIQINNKVPRVWLLTEHATSRFRSLGSFVTYAATKSRHHHLGEVREFCNQPLTKIVVETTDLPTILAAFSGS